MTTPKVFIPQVVERVTAGRRVPVYDFTPAAAFGTLTPILDPEDDPLFIARMTVKIKEALKDFTPDDYLVCVGDPTVLAACAGAIFLRRKTVKMLKWDRHMGRYIPVEVTL